MADTNLSSFLWSVADLLRGDYKQSDYGTQEPNLTGSWENGSLRT